MRIMREGVGNGKKKVVALGNFDGIHCAHKAIIENCCRYASKNGIKSCVLLFANHTLNVITKQKVKLLTSEKEKLDILNELGVDSVYIRNFDSDFMHMSPREFIEMIMEELNPQAVCVGYDYRFGYKASGNVDTLKSLGEECGFEVIVTDEMKTSDVTIKSTKIRELVLSGDVAQAELFLGRPFSITGEVVRGLRNGHKLGTPTANVEYPDDKLLPKSGVYMGYTYVDGKAYESVINVGNNPTFDAKKITVESHMLGFSDEIYGKTVRVDFIKRIRDDKKFNGIEELKEQIRNDIQTTKKQLHIGKEQ